MSSEDGIASPVRQGDALSSSTENLNKFLAELDGTSSTDSQNVRVCHVCLATVPNIRTYCTACGHPLCKTCTCPVPEGAEEAHKAFEGSGGVHLTIRDGDTLTSYNRSVPPSPTKESKDPMARAKAGTSRQHHARQEYERVEDTRHLAPATTSLLKRKSSIKPCVKENPFVVADRLTRSGPTSYTGQTIKRGTAPSECVSHISDDDYQDAIGDDQTCRAVHPGYQPYCQSVSGTESHSPSSAETGTEIRVPMEPDTSQAVLPGGVPKRLDWSQPQEDKYLENDHDHSHNKKEHRDRHTEEQQVQHGKHHDHGYSTPDRPESSARELQRTETHERYHKHPHRHSPVREPSAPRGSYHRHHEEPSTSQYSASHRQHPTDEYEVRPQKTPRKQTSPPPTKVRRQQVQADSSPARLRAMQTKSSPALAQLWQSPEPVEDFREVRSKLRQSDTPSKPKPERKDKAGEDFAEARVKLSHYSPPPKATASATKGLSEAEDRLRKIRSEAQMNTTKTTRHTEEAKKAVDKEKVIIPARTPSASSKALPARGVSTKDSKASTKDKGKEVVRGSLPGAQAAAAAAVVPAQPRQIMLGLPTAEGQDHQCDWREKYITLKSEFESVQEQPDDIGLEGLTIVLHMKGKDDLVINTDLRDLDAQ